MSEDAVPPEAHAFNPKFRRRKKHQGASWTPGSASAALGDGVYCRRCHKRHGYMKLGVSYDRTSEGKWRILWLCPITGDVLEEKVLGNG